jgi:hypothetical protein
MKATIKKVIDNLLSSYTLADASAKLPRYKHPVLIGSRALHEQINLKSPNDGINHNIYYKFSARVNFVSDWDFYMEPQHFLQWLDNSEKRERKEEQVEVLSAVTLVSNKLAKIKCLVKTNNTLRPESKEIFEFVLLVPPAAPALTSTVLTATNKEEKKTDKKKSKKKNNLLSPIQLYILCQQEQHSNLQKMERIGFGASVLVAVAKPSVLYCLKSTTFPFPIHWRKTLDDLHFISGWFDKNELSFTHELKSFSGKLTDELTAKKQEKQEKKIEKRRSKQTKNSAGTVNTTSLVNKFKKKIKNDQDFEQTVDTIKKIESWSKSSSSDENKFLYQVFILTIESLVKTILPIEFREDTIDYFWSLAVEQVFFSSGDGKLAGEKVDWKIVYNNLDKELTKNILPRVILTKMMNVITFEKQLHAEKKDLIISNSCDLFFYLSQYVCNGCIPIAEIILEYLDWDRGQSSSSSSSSSSSDDYDGSYDDYDDRFENEDEFWTSGAWNAPSRYIM